METVRERRPETSRKWPFWPRWRWPTALHSAGEGEKCHRVQSFAACCPEPRGCLPPAVLSCSPRDGEDQQRCLGHSGFPTSTQPLRAWQRNRRILTDTRGSSKGGRWAAHSPATHVGLPLAEGGIVHLDINLIHLHHGIGRRQKSGFGGLEWLHFLSSLPWYPKTWHFAGC